MEEEVEATVNHVMAQCATNKMNKRDALDFLEDVISKLEDEAEALREQLDG